MSTVTDLLGAPDVAYNPPASRRRTPPGCGAGASTSAGASTRAGKATQLKAAARRAGNVLTTGMVVMALAAFLLLAIGPRVFGYHTATMLTGSMSPLINPGDVVVTVPAPIASIRAGDIITYRIPVEDHRVETHRVTEVLTNADGTTAVRTKGDANNGVDPWTATLQGATVDKHALTVPFVGQAIRALREPLILNTLMYGAPAVLVIGLLSSIWRRDPDTAAHG